MKRIHFSWSASTIVAAGIISSAQSESGGAIIVTLPDQPIEVFRGPRPGFPDTITTFALESYDKSLATLIRNGEHFRNHWQ